MTTTHRSIANQPDGKKCIGHRPEDHGGRCHAHKDDGAPCGRWPTRGTTICKSHGAGAPQIKAKAAARIEEERQRKVLDKYDPTPVDDPLTALAELAGRARAWLETAEAEVAKLEHLDTWSESTGEQVKAIVTVFERSMETTRKVLVDMAKLDLENRIAAVLTFRAESVKQLVDLLVEFVAAERRGEARDAAVRHLRVVGGSSR